MADRCPPLTGSSALIALLFSLAIVPAAAQQPPAGPPPVTVSRPVLAPVADWLEFTGQFGAVDTVEVRARVNGYLTEIHFIDGQTVKKGEPLFTIDARPYQNALASAQAQIGQAMATVDLANNQFERANKLRQSNVMAESDYDNRFQQTKVAKAALEVARANVKDAELNLEFTRITAPIGGRIGARQVSVGNLIIGGGSGVNATLLATIVPTDPLYFNFNMSETDYLAYQRAAFAGSIASARDAKLPVQLRLIDETGWPRTGVLDFVDNEINRATGTIRARATVPNLDQFLTPGQFGRIRLPASARYEAILVPDSAVVADQSNKVVMTVTADGTVVPKLIQTGAVFEGLVVVRKGLTAEDSVIINGLMRARPGAKVTPQPGAIPPPGDLTK